MVVVNDADVDVSDIVVGDLWQHDELYYRHHEDHAQDGRVPEDLPEFFLQ